jgi:chromatin structure-remodeling complex subunit RSC1/2
VIAPAQPVPPSVPTQTLRPVAIRPRSPTPDMDVDVERGTPEPEGGVEEEARDEDSQAIIAQLERGLPRWPGLEDVGWSDDIPEVTIRSH